MSDSKEPAGETETVAAPEKKAESLSRVDSIFVRLSILNTVLAVAGVFTGAVALYAAITESDAVRKQSAAAVWPYVQFSTADWNDEEGPFFAMHLSNAGVGPAKVKEARIEIGGEVRRTWAEVVDHLLDGERASYGQSYANNRVLRPGDEITIIHTRDEALYSAFLEVLQDPGSRFAYCYCSIFDECWVADTATDIQKPVPVDSCPNYGDEAFLN